MVIGGEKTGSKPEVHRGCSVGFLWYGDSETSFRIIERLPIDGWFTQNDANGDQASGVVYFEQKKAEAKERLWTLGGLLSVHSSLRFFIH